MKAETVPYTAEAGNAQPTLPIEVARLAVFAPNWLGDAVMSLPALADVRRLLPGVGIDVVARPAVAPLFTLVPGVNETVALANGGAGSLRGRGYDAALLLPNSFQSAFVAWRAGIRGRWGYRADGRTPLLTRCVHRPAGVSQVEYYQHLVGSLGFETRPSLPSLRVPEDLAAASRASLASAGWDGRAPLVALAHGAAYGSAKRWPAESFGALARLLRDQGLAVVLVGASGDRCAAAEIAQAARSGVIDLTGRTDLPALAGVLSCARAVVTNDSGAMHVAAALARPVIAIFGPTDERETAPAGAVAPVIITHDVWCRPCMLRECPLDHRCMRGVTAASVAAAVRAAL